MLKTHLSGAGITPGRSSASCHLCKRSLNLHVIPDIAHPQREKINLDTSDFGRFWPQNDCWSHRKYLLCLLHCITILISPKLSVNGQFHVHGM